MSDAAGLAKAPWTYLAVLKSKLGEYAALRDLDPKVRARITPLIQLHHVKNDETAVADLIALLKDLRTGWDAEPPVLLDGDWMKTSSGILRAIEAAHAVGRSAIPVTGLRRPVAYQSFVKRSLEVSRQGLAIRLRREDFAEGVEMEQSLAQVMSELGVGPGETDLIVDLRDVQESHLEADEIAAIGMLNRLPWIDDWRHLALTATAMPTGVSTFPRDRITPLRRVEWALYQALRRSRDAIPRLPTFGDYGITNPEPVEESVDPKMMRVTAHLRCATEEDWLIVKSGTIDKGGIERLPELFRALVERPDYVEEKYSSADDWIEQVGKGDASPGNATTWRHRGSVRHLTLVTRQVSSQAAA